LVKVKNPAVLKKHKVKEGFILRENNILSLKQGSTKQINFTTYI
jgi:hypothetical protein